MTPAGGELTIHPSRLATSVATCSGLELHLPRFIAVDRVAQGLEMELTAGVGRQLGRGRMGIPAEAEALAEQDEASFEAVGAAGELREMGVHCGAQWDRAARRFGERGLQRGKLEDASEFRPGEDQAKGVVGQCFARDEKRPRQRHDGQAADQLPLDQAQWRIRKSSRDDLRPGASR